MKSLDDYRKVEFTTACEKELQHFAATVPAIQNVLLATPDGFDIASHITNENHSKDNLAAVGSSLFALATSLTTELALDNCQSITIDSDKGKIYIRAVEHNGHSLVLLIQTSKKAMLAHVLHGSAKLAEAIKQHL